MTPVATRPLARPLLLAADSVGDALTPMLKTVVASLVFALVGILVFALAFWIITKIVPFSIRKEIEDDQNTALAIIIASVILGIALIVSAAIHG